MSDVGLLPTVPLFSYLDSNELKRLFSRMTRQSYVRGDTIFAQNDPGEALFIIAEGSVKICRIGEGGREVILDILNEGDFFGEMSLLDGEGRSAYSTALTDVEVLLLERHDFLLLLGAYPEVAFALVSEMVHRIRQNYQQIEMLALRDAKYRIGKTLVRFAEDFGTIQNGVVHLGGPPFNSDIASMAGTRRETVSRMIKLFYKNGMIRRSGKNISIPNYTKFKRTFN